MGGPCCADVVVGGGLEAVVQFDHLNNGKGKLQRIIKPGRGGRG